MRRRGAVPSVRRMRLPSRSALRWPLAAALVLVVAVPARAGTYTFSFQEAIVDARLAGPAVHGTFAALRDTSATVAGWHGPRVRTTAGGHTAGSFAVLDLIAPSPARFVQSSLVVRYRGCAKEAAGFWMEASVLAGQSEAAGTRRALPAPTACTEVPAERPGSATLARPDRIRFKLGSTQSDGAHAAGTSVLVNQISGAIEDATAPVAALVASGATTAATRTLTWSATDAQAGPRAVTVRVTGPGGYVAAPVTWAGTAAPNQACLSGQWISGCQTAVSGTATIALPAVTGTFTAVLTATDGAGNAAVRSVDLVRVAVPVALAPPSLTGTAQVGATVTLAGGTFGNVPTSITYTFLRVRAGVAIVVRPPSASPAYVVTRADHGAVLVGRVTAANAAGEASSDSAATAVVLPALPSGGVPTLDGLPAVVDRPLAVVPGTWDNGGAPGAPAVTAVRWFLCAATCALAGHAATYVPTAADVGRSLLAEVDVANAAGTVTGRTAPTSAVVPGAPTFETPPVVSGPARVGETLTAAPPVVTGHGALPVITLGWFRCRDATPDSCSDAAGAGAAHLVAESERGVRLRVRAVATSSGGSAVTWSAPTEPVLGRNECLLVAPGSITACVGAASRVTVEAGLDRRSVLAGGVVTVRGRVTVTGEVPRPDRVAVVRGGRSLAAAVDAAGGFALVFVPELSERVTVRVSVAGRGEALALDAGEVRVTPRLTARFTVRRDRLGTVRDLRVTGRVAPRVPVPGFRLLLEGRTPQGRVVGLICRVSEQPVVRDGRFTATCRSRYLPRAARYRVRFLPGPAAPLDAAATGWQRAALR